MDVAFSRTIEAIYDTALDPPAWPTALANICGFLDTNASTINYHDLRAGQALLAYEYGTTPYWSKVYHEQFSALNPLIAPLMNGPFGKPALIADRMPTAEWRQTRLYQEWCAPQRYEDFMDMVVYRDDRRVGALSCVRLDDQPRFAAPDLAAFASIAGHIRRALDISNMFEVRKVEAHLFESVVDLMTTGVILIDRKGRVMHQNAPATRWLAGSGRSTGVEHRLSLPGVDLVKLIETVEVKRIFTAGLGPDETGGGVVGVTAMALGGEVGQLRGWPIAILISGEAFTAPLDSQLLRAMFGMTMAEVRVLEFVLRGQTAADTAAGLGVSLATIRTHIARLLTKTGAANQAELVRIVSSARAPFRAS